jgi:hypothetical protein
VVTKKYGLKLVTIDVKTIDMRTPAGEEELASLVSSALGWS